MNSIAPKIFNLNTFLNINKQAFSELLTFIDFADNRLNIGFVEIKFSQDRYILINALLEHPKCNNIQFEILDFFDPNLRFLRDELVAALKHINIQDNKKLILLIIGLEKSIGIVEEYPSVLTNLNFVRDDLRTSIPHPMLLFLPDYALTRLAKYAPDFWGWGRKVFTFKTHRSNLMTNRNAFIYPEYNITDLDLAQRQSRIEQLLNLLNEYNASSEEKTKNDLLTIGNIYNQLGNAYKALGQYKKAIIFYRKSLDISKKIEHRQVEGKSLRGLGNAYYFLGEHQKAINYGQQALKISKEIGDRVLEAKSLNDLGIAYDVLGPYPETIVLYQQALEVSREIGDRALESASLNNLSNAYDDLGQYQEAINYYQQSLKIKIEIGDRLGEAITWYNLGVTFNNTESYYDAIEAFHNARQLYQDMGLNKYVEDCDNAINILENDIHF